MPLPMDFDLEIVLLAGGRDLKLELEDLKIIKHEAFGGVWAVLKNRRYFDINDINLHIFLDLRRYCVGKLKSPRNFTQFFFGVEFLGSSFGHHLSPFT